MPSSALVFGHPVYLRYPLQPSRRKPGTLRETSDLSRWLHTFIDFRPVLAFNICVLGCSPGSQTPFEEECPTVRQPIFTAILLWVLKSPPTPGTLYLVFFSTSRSALTISHGAPKKAYFMIWAFLHTSPDRCIILQRACDDASNLVLHSIGPIITNTNSIMQGCPLAIIRIKCIIAAWSNSIAAQSTGNCKVGAFIDDRSIRANSLSQLQEAIRVTQLFDAAIDAVIEHNKTVVFATDTAGRKKVQEVTYKNRLFNCS